MPIPFSSILSSPSLPDIKCNFCRIYQASFKNDLCVGMTLFADESCKTLCVKQLNYKTTAEQLKAFFKKATEARIVKDTTTDKSKGWVLLTLTPPINA